jgi:hypothetical protein
MDNWFTSPKLLQDLIDWLMFNVQLAIFQLYSDEKKKLNAVGC